MISAGNKYNTPAPHIACSDENSGCACPPLPNEHNIRSSKRVVASPKGALRSDSSRSAGVLSTVNAPN